MTHSIHTHTHTHGSTLRATWHARTQIGDYQQFKSNAFAHTIILIKYKPVVPMSGGSIRWIPGACSVGPIPIHRR